ARCACAVPYASMRAMRRRERRSLQNARRAVQTAMLAALCVAGCGDHGSRDAERTQLEALGYVSAAREAPTQQGVTHHDPARSWPGINLYTSGHAAEAALMTMDGHELHRWSYPFWGVRKPSGRDFHRDAAEHFRRVALGPQGELVAIYDGHGL